MKSQVSEIENDALATVDSDDAMPSFNGVNTCFVAFPPKVPAVADHPNPFGVQDNSDNDDEDTAPGSPGSIGSRPVQSKYKPLDIS